MGLEKLRKAKMVELDAKGREIGGLRKQNLLYIRETSGDIADLVDIILPNISKTSPESAPKIALALGKIREVCRTLNDLYEETADEDSSN